MGQNGIPYRRQLSSLIDGAHQGETMQGTSDVGDSALHRPIRVKISNGARFYKNGVDPTGRVRCSIPRANNYSGHSPSWLSYDGCTSEAPGLPAQQFVLGEVALRTIAEPFVPFPGEASGYNDAPLSRGNQVAAFLTRVMAREVYRSIS